MSIAKPFTFTANTYAKASEVNANFDVVYSQVNSNISAIAQNATDIDNLENNKADINGSSSERFTVANPIANADAVNKQSLMNAIGNSIDYINGLIITKDSGSPEDTIIVSAGSCYDSTHAVVLNLSSSTSKQNLNQGASATYYVYIIGNSTGSLIDILISSESITPSLPTGYSLYRQIGSYTTNSESKIDSISYYGTESDGNKNSNAVISGVMPNYSAGIAIPKRYEYPWYYNDGDWYAPSDGWIFVQMGTIGQIFSINGVQLYGDTRANANYAYPCQFQPISKGDSFTFRVDQNNWMFPTFYPVKGVN